MPTDTPPFLDHLRTLTNWELCEEWWARQETGKLDEHIGRIGIGHGTAGWLIVQEMAARFVKLAASSELSDVITDPTRVEVI